MLTSDPNNVNLSVYYEGDINWPWVCIPIQGYPAFTSGDKFIYYDPNIALYVVI
ncbi:MAG: hypothetical protein BWY21_00551 [Parcubacteria group bacterium ADurb.Bin216]|nr:MAG: hypothetical protein BWY21_00551 [Parcubacteria group bacterium ADurb.Bin216]